MKEINAKRLELVNFGLSEVHSFLLTKRKFTKILGLVNLKNKTEAVILVG